MGMRPRANLYRIGDPLTQLICFNFFFFFFCFFIRNTDNEKMNENYFVGDPLTHLMQSIEHSSLSTELVLNIFAILMLCNVQILSISA